MPRRPRLDMPGIPLHITQRGVNRAAIFVDDDDRSHYLALLRREFQNADVALHAYFLMGNHVYLLAAAPEPSAISHALGARASATCRRSTDAIDAPARCSKGRFKSCLVDSDGYLLTVYRYIELNPVRAMMNDAPETYRWSSARINLGRRHDPLVTPHAVFLALGQDDAAATPRTSNGSMSLWHLWISKRRCTSSYLSPQLCSQQLFMSGGRMRCDDRVAFGVERDGTDG